MATTKSKTTAKPKTTAKAAKPKSSSAAKRPSRRTSSKPTASKATSQPTKAASPSPVADSAGRIAISLSEPLAQGTQIVATVRGLEPGETVVAHIEGPLGRRETMRLRADPAGMTQVFVHGPKPGPYDVSLKADSGHAHTQFEVK